VRELVSKLDGFEAASDPAQEQRARHVYDNLLLGHRDRVDVTVVDQLYYKPQWGEPFLRRSRSRTLLLVESDELDLPRIHIWPRRSGLGRDDIRETGWPQWWNESYAWSGDTDDALSAILSHQVLGFFEARERVHLECRGGRLLYHWGVLVEPDQIPWFVEDGMELIALLPRG
jgi:hypothetical protein